MIVIYKIKNVLFDAVLSIILFIVNLQLTYTNLATK